MNERLTRRWQVLVVLAQPAVETQPGKRPLDDPPFRQDLEPLYSIRPLDDLQVDRLTLPEGPHPFPDAPSLDGIGPNLAQSGETVRQGSEDCPGPVAVLGAGRVDHHAQDQAEGIDQDVALAAKGLLARVVAAFGPAAISRLDALTVDDGCARLTLPPLLLAQVATQAVVNALPGPVQAPSPEVAIDGLPRRILARQGRPGTSRARQVEDGVERQAHVSLPVPAAGFGRRDKGFDILPLSVGKVAGVELIAHTLMLPKPAETF